MKTYALLSIGTRGDMEPFLAFGKELERQGHTIHCIMPEQFRELVMETGFVFHGLDRRFLELLENESGRAIMGQKGSGFRRIVQLLQLARESMALQHELLQEQRDYLLAIQPDNIVYHPKCIYARVWAMAQPERAVLLSPVPCMIHPVKAYPHIGINGNFGERINLLTYRLVNALTARMTTRFVRPFRSDFSQVDLRYRSILGFMNNRERVDYAISPTLFPRPDYWPEQARIVGFRERDKTATWSPDAELVDFIEASKQTGAKLIFISFGSMVNAAPEATTRSIVAVLRKHRIQAIINTSSGGLVELSDAPDHVFFTRDVPYDWIFPQVHSVVHHGGSGTTHTALKHGCASLIIPHIIDQFFWNRRIADLNAGPLGIKVKQLKEKTFEPLLLDLRNNEVYRQRAESIQRQLRVETAEI